MARKRLLWQLYPSYLGVTLVALLAVTWFFSDALRQFHIFQTEQDLKARAHLVAAQVQRRLEDGARDGVDALSKDLGRRSGTRITVVGPDGRVLGDSEEDPARMDNHGDRPEIRRALVGDVGVADRFSQTLQQRMMYVALPVRSAGGVIGSVRAALPVTAIDRTLSAIYWRLAGGGVAVALVAAAVSLVVARRLSRPLEQMQRGARRFASGQLGRRLAVPESEEMGALAETLNRMAAHLDDRINTVLRQRNEQEAVLGSMVEGVVAVDAEERIIRLNQAAADLLDVHPGSVQGRPIQEVVRKVDLQRFVARALAEEGPVEGELTLRVQGEERSLQAHGTLLRDAGGERIGALVVLNDITGLRRLERVRRDFVANVSHELKTPITAIKGFAETLRGGALEEPAEARRFVDIILKQADRLNAIIEDLLALSRMEQGGEKGRVPLERGRIRPVLEAAIQACEIGARQKGLGINLDCAEGLEARINAPLLEQAVVNLVNNAVNYSESGGKVLVSAARFQQEVVIRVQDWGVGIAAEHLPRLFERFYRVDRARSRSLGGTGLGLSIVKHIAQAHQGKVSVTSTPGEGSVFCLRLPSP